MPPCISVRRSIGRSVHQYFHRATAIINDALFIKARSQEESLVITSSYNHSIKYEDASLTLWALFYTAIAAIYGHHIYF